MPHAVDNFHGVQLAVKRPGVPIPEIGVVNNAQRLDDLYDVHFGINTDDFNSEINHSDAAQADLHGLGPRILDIIQRGGRTAEDTWFEAQGHARARGATPNFQAFFATFNQGRAVDAAKRAFPAGAKISGAAVGGQAKYDSVTTHKGGGYNHNLQLGTRWSKTALEHGLSTAQGKIHFHLDGMGDIGTILGKAGNYSHNVTSRELRYVYRNWERFQRKVIFYNGYTAAKCAVRVEPPWPQWLPDSSRSTCKKCNTAFGLLTWRHHCRQCGEVFCDKCSSKRKALPYPVMRPGHARERGLVRVCDDCF